MNIELAIKEFIKYTENYDLNNEHLKHKQGHSLRVMQISKQIAEGLNLSQEEIEIAMLIGLLHDIGRFEQYVRFQNYNVISQFDHGDYAVEILNKDMRKYIETEKYDEIIKKAIKNHNKYEIEKGLTEEELKFAKLIRDADKIDILSEAVNKFWKGEEQKVNQSKMSQEIYYNFLKNEKIKIEKDRDYNTIDDMFITLAFVYDINYKESYEIIKKADYINKIINRFNFVDVETDKRVKELIKNLNQYINQKAK